MRTLLPALMLAALLTGCSTTIPDMVLVQGGSFEMGNTFEGGDDDERPVHHVELDSFLIARTELTVGQFRKFIEATGYVTTAEQGKGCRVFGDVESGRKRDSSWRNVYYEQDDRHPVVCVSWYDAVEYCNWRSREEGLEPCFSGSGKEITCDFSANGYRLPTEAEWEYAARSGGKSYKYAWGDGEPYIDGRLAGNTRDQAAARQFGLKKIWEGYDDGYAYTAPAGSFAPNELGIHDFSGSVYEWCWDWYDQYYYANTAAKNPAGPETGTNRASRDAGFSCSISQECVASRGRGNPKLTFSWGGFRIARSIP
ncbi:MAG: formylglycine-generating enzyme family protein [Phycisphaerales bacterium]|nr:MAG: formylglycine-generating enzyme family protein [Phycisphaerales bacterium]